MYRLSKKVLGIKSGGKTMSDSLLERKVFCKFCGERLIFKKKSWFFNEVRFFAIEFKDGYACDPCANKAWQKVWGIKQ